MRNLCLFALVVVLLALPALAVDVPVPSAVTFSQKWDKVGFSHSLWDAFLADRVDRGGLVDYRAARHDARLEEYLYRLAHTDPSALRGSDARKAFWINAYNALAIQGVLETLPADGNAWRAYRVVDQPIDGLPPNKGFFQGLRFVVGGVRYTLDEIEKRILLRRWEDIDRTQVAKYQTIAPEKGDPRVHFALVCCAVGCPPLQQFAYRGKSIEAQLAGATRGFLADPNRSRFDPSDRVWRVSELLNWYGADFVNPDYEATAKNVFQFAARYVRDKALATSLETKDWRVDYLKYNWRLNIRE